MLDKLNPYAGALKAGLLIAALVGLGVLTWSWHSRGQEIARLTDWQGQVVIAATDATVTPDSRGVRKALNPEQVPAAFTALKASLDSALGTLQQVDRETAAAKSRADEADARLASQQKAFDRQYAASQKRIESLASRLPAETPAEQCEAISESSRSAWEGWR